MASANDKDETAEQYDEPVLIRLGAEDTGGAQGRFSEEFQEDLFRYHAIVLDDIEERRSSVRTSSR